MKTISIVTLLSIASGLLLTASEPTAPVASHLERPDQPYLPGPDLLVPGATSVSLAPAGSVQVNVDSFGRNIIGDAANEPSIATDPTSTPFFDPGGRPSRIAIGWRQFDTVASNYRQAGYAFSVNGGTSWTKRVLDPGEFRSDPILVADNNGRLFYNSLRTDSDFSFLCVDVWKSNSGLNWLTGAGLTWCCPTTAFAGDKAWMTIDRRSGGVLGSGHLYCNWSAGTGCAGIPAGSSFTRSTDHGGTWMTPIAIPNSPFFGTLAVGADGAVYVAGRTNNDSGGTLPLAVAKSTNALNPTVTPSWAFSHRGNFLGGPPGFGGPLNPDGLLGQVWIATHPTLSSHVYLLASVISSTGSDPLDVMFSRSFDGGGTWRAPVRVNDDSAFNGASQWFGTMSVAPNGRIDAVWNDTRDDSHNVRSRLYYAFSLDEGATWSKNRAITPAWDSRIGFPQQNKIGDYYQMISDNTSASLAYAATFNGEQDIYFTRIVPNFFDFFTTGSFDLAPTASTVAVHERLNYALTWTVPEPENWHDLESLQLRIRDDEDTILSVLFDEASSTFSLLNEATDEFEDGFAAGSPNRLQTPRATLHLAETSVVGSGPTGPSVTLNLSLSFKPQAAGRTFVVEVAASDDLGHHDDFASAGTLTVSSGK